MNLGDWLGSQARQFRERNDRERLRMIQCYVEGYDARETGPDQAYAAFSEGRRLAELLGEPWWVLFYQNECVEALIHFKRDYRNVLEQAVRCALEARKPTNAAYPGRYSIWDALVSAYIGIDAEGHADRIQEAIDHLDREIPREPDGSRYLLFARQRIFAMERELLREAYEASMAELELASTDQDESRAVHFATFVYCDLCHIAAIVGDNDTLAQWAETARELAEVKGHQCEQSEALAWQALASLRAGDEGQARQLYTRATTQMSRLGMPPKNAYYDALAFYHLDSGDPEAALAVRDDELASIVDRGRLLYETRVRLSRCELLRQLGRLAPSDVEATREAARRLQKPDKYLERLEALLAQ